MLRTKAFFPPVFLYFEDPGEGGLIQVFICFAYPIVQGHFQNISHFGYHFNPGLHLIALIAADHRAFGL
jgi:hypothetical protein